jgi:histidine kinase
MRLPARLLASYALVIAVGAAAAYLTVRLLAPPIFDRHMGMGSGMGMGSPRSGTTPHAALLYALNVALLVAVAASAVAGGLVAALMAARLTRPLEQVRAATRRIAAGDYTARVPEPREPELAALAADVTTLATRLAETETRRVRLLGDVAHEMRTPLTALDGYVEGLIDGVFTAEPEHLQVMADELRRLHRLADDVSTLSRAEEQRLELQPSQVDLAALVGTAAERLRPQFVDAGVELEVRADPAVAARVDGDRVAQVVTNLLGNALLASAAGGRVSVEVSAGAGVATVAVTDTGVGLSEEDCERVFERFYRAPTGTRRSAGSGVGLTIARGFARAHGGELTARSAGPGTGATFTLTLPLNRPPS